MKTSDIEGEKLDQDQVRSSIARRLGLDIGGLIARRSPCRRRRGDDARCHAALRRAAHEERLCAWHAALFPTGYSGMRRSPSRNGAATIRGRCRSFPAAIGREKVHYQAPASQPSAARDADVPEVVQRGARPSTRSLKAGLAHLWFVTMHPFEDGNGRIARAIADMALARSEVAASASTACPRKYGRSGASMTCWNRRKRATWTSPPGLHGSWTAWIAHVTR